MDEPRILYFRQGGEYHALMSVFSGIIPDVPLGDEKQLVRLTYYQGHSLNCSIRYNNEKKTVTKSLFETAVNANLGEDEPRYKFREGNGQIDDRRRIEHSML